MTQCERLSDRMPEVAIGRVGWTAEEQAHLDVCESCRAEWHLVRATAHLGTSLPAGPDPHLLTTAVLERVAGARAAVRTRRRILLLVGVAAAAMVVMTVKIARPPAGGTTPDQTPVATVPSVSTTPSTPTPPEPAPAVASAPRLVALPELDDLSDAELETILGSLNGSAAMPGVTDGPPFDNLDDHELERVLAAWEG